MSNNEDTLNVPTLNEEELLNLQALPEDQKDKIIQVMLTQQYSGPIMPPQLLRELESIIPGGAERVLALSEKEQTHRHLVVECGATTERWQVKVSLIGGMLAFAVLVAAILYCAIHSYTAGVVALGGIGAFGVISHIIRLPKKEEKPQKK